MATLIITRRLYLIASLQSVDVPSTSARHRTLAIEWTIGLLIPLIVAGPLYYVVQTYRFRITRGFGCTNSPGESVLEVLLIHIWTVVPPLTSIIVYYPKVAYTFFHHSRAVNQFLRSNNSVTRTNYMRILAVASIDIVLTLPMSITFLVLQILMRTNGPLPLYEGWTVVHADWTSILVVEKMENTAEFVEAYFSHWTSPILAFTIFGLFGMTAEARALYRRLFNPAARWIGWKCTPYTQDARASSGSLGFATRSQEASLDSDVETGRHSIETNTASVVPSRAEDLLNVDAITAHPEAEESEKARNHDNIQNQDYVQSEGRDDAEGPSR
ncbi:STE3-domain-containing protein [Peniophora sp. CONT]|nr:STE3-domain-containing protein [Peniophora sp. CONT]